jgi:UDP-N-acetylmuramyl pentapeptide phosphotransferase/UDP-N-acetylglucosamine-1-phosphate transferase
MHLALPVLATLAACALAALYMRALSASGRLEHPNQRSMHAEAVPSGAGVAIVFVALVLWTSTQTITLERSHALLLAAFAALSTLSWIDDQYRLPPAVRLAAHASAVALLLGSLPPDVRILPACPLALERAVLGLAWIWFVNLFNFMDGIDGLAGTETIAIAAGYAAVVRVAGFDTALSELGLLVAAACAGYLVWNWHPAKVFMGDAGSIPLGFLLGWLMIDLACHGHWAAAVILPLYFTADATLTLLNRLRFGERPWRPHRSHFYQRAVLGGTTPAAIVLRVVAANGLLIALAIVSTWFPVAALICAAAVVAALLLDMERLARMRLG